MLINAIEFSRFKTSGHSMFGSTPAEEWQRLYPPTEANLCEWALRSLIIQKGNEVVLIDTGFSWLDRHILTDYKVDKIVPADVHLQQQGINPEKITHVVHTHLHLDHCGGSFTENDAGNIIPAFPNAQYIVSKKQFEAAQSPSVFEHDSFQREIIEAFKTHNNLYLIERECSIFPWLELLLFDGHTEGLIVPVIHQGKDAVVFVGDLIPSVAHLNLNTTMDYDVNKLLSLVEREEFLEEVYENEYFLFFQHDAINQCCSVNKNGGKYNSGQIVLLNNLPGFVNPTGLH